MGLSKYVKTTPLFYALRIKSVQQLIYQHKLSFVRQLHKVDLTRKIFEYLDEKYKFDTIPTDSFFSYYKKIVTKCGLERRVLNKFKINQALNAHFGFENDKYGLVDSITTVLKRFEHYGDNKLALLLLTNLLVITIRNSS